MCSKDKLKTVTDEVVRGILSASDKIARIVLYGSQARGDSTLGSDIDILVVVSVPKENLYCLKKALWKVTNKISFDYDEVVSLCVSTEDECNLMADSLFYKNVAKDGVELYGRAS